MKRYGFQEMSISGFTFHDIIDTEDNCNVVYRTKNYCDAIRKYKEFNNMTEDEYFRICSHCGKPIEWDGFMVVADGGIGWGYYCEENCLYSVYTEEEAAKFVKEVLL